MRADQHEGVLNDTEVKRRADKANSRAKEILHHDLLALTENGAFLRWFGKYAYPALVQNFPVNNGSLLAHFMGRRELILQVVDEMDRESPGFIARILAARSDFENELLKAEER